MIRYIVEPKSRKEIRHFAKTLREILSLEKELRIPIVEVLDVLPEIYDGFSYEIVEDGDLPHNIHAETDVRTGHIRIKESVYEGACNGEGRDRMTIAHEIGHYFLLCHCGLSLQRTFWHKKVEPYNDPEWQAKCFAGEFMIDQQLTASMSVQEIVDACGVSFDAARYQYNHRN